MRSQRAPRVWPRANPKAIWNNRFEIAAALKSRADWTQNEGEISVAKRRIRLRGVNGDVDGKIWENETLVRAGRLATLEIVLDDSSVSRRHAEIRPTAAGWRVYGPAQAARLHQVLALKGLGVPLRQIAELMHGRLATLDAVLEVQQQALVARRAQDKAALARIARARAALARDEPLSLDDLTKLTKETAMSEKLRVGDEEWSERLKPLVDKHYTPEQRALLIERQPRITFRPARTLSAVASLAGCSASLVRQSLTI